jgi:type IV pilus assembly protein PilV
MACTGSTRPDRQRGFTLLEVLVSLLIFAFGILGLVGLQATAVRFATDAQQRAEATFLADQLLGRMLISDPSTIDTFAHHPGGTTPCAPMGDPSTSPVVAEWLDDVAAALPNAGGTRQQIVVDAATSQVTVHLCWRNGNDATHTLVVSNQVQWQ